MSQPTRFVITRDFSDDEGNGVAGRSTVLTAALDSLFVDLQSTTDQICDNLALIQRDDGELLDGVVKLHTLGSDVLTLIASPSLSVEGPWMTATAYEMGDVVLEAGIAYICFVAHTSGTFATDLAAGNWGPLTVNVTATDVVFSPTGTLEAVNVQSAIEELDAEIRPVQGVLSDQLFATL